MKYSGKSYLNADGVPRLGRRMRPACSDECRLKCYQKLTDSQRQRIFDEYYDLADLHQQWQYLGRYMDKTVPKQKIRFRDRTAVVRVHQTRRNNVKYYLQTDTDRLRVCMKMFLATFDISHRVLLTVAKKTDEQGVLVKKDGRGSRYKKQKHKNQLEDACTSSETEPENYCATSSSVTDLLE